MDVGNAIGAASLPSHISSLFYSSNESNRAGVFFLFLSYCVAIAFGSSEFRLIRIQARSTSVSCDRFHSIRTAPTAIIVDYISFNSNKFYRFHCPSRWTSSIQSNPFGSARGGFGFNWRLFQGLVAHQSSSWVRWLRPMRGPTEPMLSSSLTAAPVFNWCS